MERSGLEPESVGGWPWSHPQHSSPCPGLGSNQHLSGFDRALDLRAARARRSGEWGSPEQKRSSSVFKRSADGALPPRTACAFARRPARESEWVTPSNDECRDSLDPWALSARDGMGHRCSSWTNMRVPVVEALPRREMARGRSMTKRRKRKGRPGFPGRPSDALARIREKDRLGLTPRVRDPIRAAVETRETRRFTGENADESARSTAHDRRARHPRRGMASVARAKGDPIVEGREHD